MYSIKNVYNTIQIRIILTTNMKIYRETHIRKAEIAQLILLHQLYMQRGSRGLIFQRGTAIRWCYGGGRFSEDLDFVTPVVCL